MAAILGKVATKLITDPKAMAAFESGMKAASNVADKAKDLIGWQEAINTFMQVFEPLAAPMQVIAGQLSGGIVENVVKLTGTLMEQLQSPEIQFFVQRQIDYWNFLLEKGNIALGYLDDFLRWISGIGAFLSDKLAPIMKPTMDLLNQLGAFLDTSFKGFMDWMMNTVMPWFNTYLMPPIKDFIDFLTRFGTDILNGLLIPAFEKITDMFYQLWETLEKLTGIDINKFFADVGNTISGWFT